MTFYDVIYALGLGAAAPALLVAPRLRAKVGSALRERMAHEPARQGDEPAVMIHAVSVGELNATPALIRTLQQARPELRFIVTTTTTTGWARAQELYGKDPRITPVRFPLDLSGAVNRLLDGQRPSAVVLMELEVWPNFMRSCARRRIPVVLVNGRLTPSSYRNYRRAAWLTAPMFRRLAAVCAQEQVYANRFIGAGVPAERVRVTGTMKFDTAQIAAAIPGADDLGLAVGLRPCEEPIWVCGSTGPGEEEIVLAAYADLLKSHPALRLVIVPRKPERFDEVADLIRGRGYGLVRRSKPGESPPPSTDRQPTVVLGDTMGELRKFYSLASVVFVGRTLVDLGHRQHGSDMIEPAALAKPVVVGPFTHNFAEVMNRFRAAGAMPEVNDGPALRDAIAALLENPLQAAEMGKKAQDVVRAGQGATARHAEMILSMLPETSGAAAPSKTSTGL